jgi:hypothetical protein
MSSFGSQHAEEIRQGITCPQCEYDLRGLPGAVVICPECGLEVDVAKVVVSRWTAPWYRAPGLNALFLPLAWIFLATLIAICAGLVLFEFHMRSTPWVALFTAVLIIGVWLILLARLRNRLDNDMAIPLALFAHVVFVMYIAAIVMFLPAIILMMDAVFHGTAIAAIIHAVWLAFSIGLFWAARWSERYIASHCIRQHLVNLARSGTMNA